MDFRTEFKLKPFRKSISYKDKLLFLGSCFAENISIYFEQNRFQVNKNPLGILYHPVAINRLLDMALNKNHDPNEFSFNHAGLWSNFDAHSSLSKSKKQELTKTLENAVSETEQLVKQSHFIFITLGSAWVYKLIDNNKIVANCHKLPQNQFKKEFLNLESVENTLDEIVNKVNQVNPDAEIIFTVSPVRHLKDGFINNQMSKAVLHLAIQNYIKKHNNTHYFPSYELVLDDLRDYRFYKNDLLHPNSLALDYIWSKIQEVYFNDKTKALLKQVDVINKRLKHRFFNPNSQDSSAFVAKTDGMIKQLKANHPEILI